MQLTELLYPTVGLLALLLSNCSQTVHGDLSGGNPGTAKLCVYHLPCGLPRLPLIPYNSEQHIRTVFQTLGNKNFPWVMELPTPGITPDTGLCFFMWLWSWARNGFSEFCWSFVFIFWISGTKSTRNRFESLCK